MLGTVRCAGDLLDLFDPEKPEWGATEVSRRLQIPKSKAHEMLVSLEAIGLLRRAGRGRFRLGWRTITLGQRLLRSEFTAVEARVLRELGEHLNVPVDLVIRDGDRCVPIGRYGATDDDAVSSHLITSTSSAAGKVLLAGMSEAELRNLMPNHGLDVELAAVRERRIAFAVSETKRAVAAPVQDWGGTVLAAVTVSVGHEEWAARGQRLIRGVPGAAQRISGTLRRRREQALPNRQTTVAGETVTSS